MCAWHEKQGINHFIFACYDPGLLKRSRIPTQARARTSRRRRRIRSKLRTGRGSQKDGQRGAKGRRHRRRTDFWAAASIFLLRHRPDRSGLSEMPKMPVDLDPDRCSVQADKILFASHFLILLFIPPLTFREIPETCRSPKLFNFGYGTGTSSRRFPNSFCFWGRSGISILPELPKVCDEKIVETFELDIPACFFLMRLWFQHERERERERESARACMRENMQEPKSVCVCVFVCAGESENLCKYLMVKSRRTYFESWDVFWLWNRSSRKSLAQKKLQTRIGIDWLDCAKKTIIWALTLERSAHLPSNNLLASTS